MPAPLIILSERRTGSNLLIDALAQQPGIQSFEEILNLNQNPELRDLDGPQSLEWMHQRLASAAAQPLAKVQFEQLDRCEIGIADFLEHFADSSFVLLFRQPILDQYLSLQRAEQSGRWVRKSDDARHDESIELTVDVAHFTDFATRSIERYGQADALLRSGATRQPWVAVRYGEMAEDLETVVELICSTLRAAPAQTFARRLHRQERRALAQQVTNYRDVEPLRDDPRYRHQLTTTLSEQPS